MTKYFLEPTFGFFRKVTVLALSAALTGAAAAQNLVPNPSFELMTSCPTGLSSSQIQGVTLWTAPTQGSPDYFHSCASLGSGVSTPGNDFGSQAPHTGQAYAGFILRPSNDYREYLEIPLATPLVGGTSYDVSYYVSLADVAQWGIDKFGAYLSVGSVGPVNNSDVLSFTPQVVNPTGNFITDKSGWTLVTGTYAALGGETHLVIGNFADNLSTTPITGLGGFYPGSYYYIDDVSVAVTTTAAPVSVGGRITTSDGRGIGKVKVLMAGSTGAVRQALTNPFGYYRFNDVTAGRTVFISVSAKGYRFGESPRVITISDDLAEVNFVSAD